MHLLVAELYLNCSFIWMQKGDGSLASTSGGQQSASGLKLVKPRSGVQQKKKRRSGTHKGAKSTKRKKRRKIVRTKVKVLEDGTTVVVKTRRRRKIKRKGKGKKKVNFLLRCVACTGIRQRSLPVIDHLVLV
jgi:hypothetical protein